MKYVDEYRSNDLSRRYSELIKQVTKNEWTIMEVCGGQTHSIVRFGLLDLLPPQINLIHGPGCPVCVTPLETIDKALLIARNPDVIMCTFGDMIRVPGSHNDLQSLKASGANIRIVYSPLECIDIALKNPDKDVVFLAVGFETTAPGNAMLVKLAHKKQIKNLSLIVSHVLVPPAIKSLLSSKDNRVQGFLAAGHVCTIMGDQAYKEIVNDYKVPIVITGFEPADILQGLLMCIKQLESGQAKLENQYVRSVHKNGNLPAQQIIKEIFQVKPNKWRGIGTIENSGLELKDKYKDFDAESRFNLDKIQTREPKICISGLILQGIKKPKDCKAFGTHCTPDNPIGAPMVSGEGACAAYYKYKRQE